MFDGGPAFRSGGGRTAPLTAVLVVTVAVSLCLGYAAWGSARGHRAAVEATLRDYTGMAARELSRLSRESLDWLIDEAVHDRRRRRAWAAGIRRELDAALERHECPCPELRRPLAVYRAVLAEGEIDVEPRAPGDAVASGVLASLEAEQARGGLPSHGVLLAGAGAVREEPVAIAYATADDRGEGPAVLEGFVMSLEGLGELVEHWYQHNALLPPAPGRTSSNDSLFHARVETPEGVMVFTSGHGERGGLTSVDTLGPQWGGLHVVVDVREGRADRLVAGGLPASRAPLFLGLLGLVVVVGSAGLVQVRREEELARLRDDFVSGVSHELRTPLTQIRMFAELHGADKLRSEEDRRRAIAVIDREARRLSNLVESVLQYTRLRRGPDTAAVGAIDVRRAVDEAVEGFGPLLEAAGASLDVETPPGVSVVAPPGGVRQILVNLLDNALKYGPHGQTIRVRAAVSGERVRLSVVDEGPGVPPGDRAKIWVPYRRLRQDVGRETGSGLGLAVVAGLARRSGGSAWVEDAPGGGACFVVELPTARRPAPSELREQPA